MYKYNVIGMLGLHTFPPYISIEQDSPLLSLYKYKEINNKKVILFTQTFLKCDLWKESSSPCFSSEQHQHIASTKSYSSNQPL